ncbi:MAG: ABC transporter ATP-binding protein [Pirellulaceae bacterium]
MLQIEKLKKSFQQPDGGQVPILDVENFRIDSGEQVVLIGPSGCGKTTLLHIIAGIVRTDSGSVKLDGVEITKFSEAARDRIRAHKLGYVFQTFNLLPAFTALENVMLGMTFASGKHSVSRAKELLASVGLSHRLGNRPNTMSVGEQQRVAVARAMANQPKLLLADEPTANVDPGNQQQIVDLIRERCRDEGIAMLMVTHSMDVAKQFDRVERLEEINLVVANAKGGRG